MSGVTTVVLAGVGGQGTILAGDVLAKVAMAEGFDVRLSEVHGMAQRGGSVVTFVRFGECVESPVADPGTADHLIAFEVIEAARQLPLLRPDGRLVVNQRVVPPLPVLTGAAAVPGDLEAALAAQGAIFIDADALACEAGSSKSANIVLVGAASAGLPFSEATWAEAIAARVPPATVEANLRAFQLGKEACLRGACRS
ncbi:MAG: indolepyruvate oxidoreductase subunit beta [Anaerosomatales bacterium]|nr:indolepyruvate oxidoreductase subunit beta [Anaerosomatales bacterium]